LAVGQDRVSGGALWTGLDWNAHGETLARTGNVVVGEDFWLVKGALCSDIVVLDVEERAV